MTLVLLTFDFIDKSGSGSRNFLGHLNKLSLGGRIIGPICCIARSRGDGGRMIGNERCRAKDLRLIEFRTKESLTGSFNLVCGFVDGVDVDEAWATSDGSRI